MWSGRLQATVWAPVAVSVANSSLCCITSCIACIKRTHICPLVDVLVELSWARNWPSSRCHVGGDQPTVLIDVRVGQLERSGWKWELAWLSSTSGAYQVFVASPIDKFGQLKTSACFEFKWAEMDQVVVASACGSGAGWSFKLINKLVSNTFAAWLQIFHSLAWLTWQG